MATYQVSSPDGQSYEITAPDGASDRDVMQYAQNQWLKTPKAAPAGSPIPTGPLSVLPDWAQANIIGAGRTGDKIVAGMSQLGTGAKVAAQQLLGMDNRQGLQDLAALEQQQKGNDQAYSGLQQQHPFATAIGESLPALAIPMGQTTLAGRLLAPALGMGAMEGAQYGDPLQRGIKAAGGFASGLGGGVTSEAISRLVQPVRNVMGGAEQSAAKAASEKIGAPILPSQLTGSPDLARVEDALARYPGSAGVMQNFLGRQRQAVNETAQRAVLQPGEDLTTAGQATAKASMGGQYNAMRAAIPDGLPAQQPMFDAIDAATAKLSQGSTSGKQGALGMLSELKDKLYGAKSLTPEEYSSWVSDLAAAARETTNPTVKAALKGVGAKMDELARGPLNPEWQKLDQAYAALKTLQKPGIVNPVTGDVSAAKVAGQLERYATGARATPLADVAAYARAVPQLRAGSPTAERGAVSIPGMANALWRYPLAKILTADFTRDYLARGLLGDTVSPRMAGLLANTAGRTALPFGAAPIAGLLAPQTLRSQ